jgi:2-polyprenyl-6-methoxyphenol hydroxylase-like FAD-dependent oxidoreductase
LFDHARVRLKLAIIGSGVAGTAAAVFLARAGHSVHVYEAVNDPQPIGAGLLLQPTGLAVLNAMGLLSEVLSLGAKVQHLYGDTPSGRPVLDMNYADYHPSAFGVGVQRGALMGVLWQALRRCQQELDADWRCGQAVDDWQVRSGQVELRSGGRTLDAYDGVILANGAFSKLRHSMQVPQHERTYPWGAVWTVLPQVPGSPVTQLRQRYRRAQQMLGLMPVGYAYGQADGTHPAGINLFWSLPAEQLAQWPQRGLADWKREVTDLYPACAPLLESLGDASQMRQARYADVVMARWHDGPVLAVGDCAHGMSPQLGQGANMALIDAAVLARCVSQNQPSPAHGKAVDAWQAALAQYSHTRRSHLQFYHRASRGLTPLFQSDQLLAPWLRDRFFRCGSQLPFVRQHSMAALAGVKTGWVFGRLEL